MSLFGFIKQKYTCNLDSVIKLNLLKDKSAKEIVEIWNGFHSALPECVSMAMNLKKREILMTRMNSHPLFIQPIIRDLRFFFLLSHITEANKFITFHEVVEKETNPLEKDPELLLRIFTELSEEKNICLLRGDILEKAISKSEADIVMRGLVAFYIEDSLFNEFVKPFNDDYTNFNHDEFIEEYFSRFTRRKYEEEEKLKESIK